jgi:hypothetical protein
MRRAARRIEIAGLVMVVVAILAGLVALVTISSGEDSGGEAVRSAVLTWILLLPLAIAIYSIGEYLGLMAEDR